VWQVGGGHGLRWSARSERRLVCEAVDRGPHSFVFFFNLSKIGSTWKLKKKGVRVAWDIMNIFLHGADIQFPTGIELKILDQIHHLKFC
jgi:hypothetical protein